MKLKCWQTTLCTGYARGSILRASLSLSNSFAPQHPSGLVTSISMLQWGKLRHIVVGHSASKVIGPGFECKHLVSESWTLNASQSTPLNSAFLIKMSTEGDSCSVTPTQNCPPTQLRSCIYIAF